MCSHLTHQARFPPRFHRDPDVSKAWIQAQCASGLCEAALMCAPYTRGQGFEWQVFPRQRHWPLFPASQKLRSPWDPWPIREHLFQSFLGTGLSPFAAMTFPVHSDPGIWTDAQRGASVRDGWSTVRAERIKCGVTVVTPGPRCLYTSAYLLIGPR